MTLFKSLLLGSAAGLVAIAGASAADLPSKKAAPATYVKICDAYGAGFFYIPGTETCVKLGGYTRYELQYTPGKDILKPTTAGVAPIVGHYAATQDTFGSEYRGRIDVDARTPTSMPVTTLESAEAIAAALAASALVCLSFNASWVQTCARAAPDLQWHGGARGGQALRAGAVQGGAGSGGLCVLWVQHCGLLRGGAPAGALG
jgi:hypothetical protein